MHEIIVAVNKQSERIMELSAQVEHLSKSPSQQLQRKYFDNETAAKVLHISERTLYKLRLAGEINYARIRRRVIYQAEDIHAYIEARFRKK